MEIKLSSRDTKIVGTSLLVGGLVSAFMLSGEAPEPVDMPQLDMALAQYITSDEVQSHIRAVNACGADATLVTKQSGGSITVDFQITGEDANFESCMTYSEQVDEAVADYLRDPAVREQIQLLNACGADVEVDVTRNGDDVTIEFDSSTPSDFNECMQDRFLENLAQSGVEYTAPDLNVAPE